MFRPASHSSHQRREQGEFYVHFRQLRLICKCWNQTCICISEFCNSIVLMQIWVHI
jgi:hypothetical protein